MKATITILTICLSHALLAGPLEDINARRAAKADDLQRWYRQELARVATKATSQQAKKEILCNVQWTWDVGQAQVPTLTFSKTGTGEHSYRGTPFSWSMDGWCVTMTIADGRVATATIDPATMTLSGLEFAKGKADASKKTKGEPMPPEKKL